MKPRVINYNLEPPKNQHQLVLWYLIKYKDFSLKDLINDSMFFKFQTRLSELELKYMDHLAERTLQYFTNRFNHKSKYYTYKAIDIEKCIELYKLIK